jgi:hypothetical protein
MLLWCWQLHVIPALCPECWETSLFPWFACTTRMSVYNHSGPTMMAHQIQQQNFSIFYQLLIDVDFFTSGNMLFPSLVFCGKHLKKEKWGIFFRNIFPPLQNFQWNCYEIIDLSVWAFWLLMSATWCYSRRFQGRGEKRGQTSLIAEAHWRWGCCQPQIGPEIPPAHLVGIHKKNSWN